MPKQESPCRNRLSILGLASKKTDLRQFCVAVTASHYSPLVPLILLLSTHLFEKKKKNSADVHHTGTIIGCSTALLSRHMPAERESGIDPESSCFS